MITDSPIPPSRGIHLRGVTIYTCRSSGFGRPPRTDAADGADVPNESLVDALGEEDGLGALEAVVIVRDCWFSTPALVAWLRSTAEALERGALPGPGDQAGNPVVVEERAL